MSAGQSVLIAVLTEVLVTVLNTDVMTAAANKFLRIYYASVKEYIAALDNATSPLN